MSFLRRFVNLVPYGIISALLITGIVVLVVDINQSSADLSVKTLTSVKPAPRVNYIPTKSKAGHKVDISNSILSARAKKPVVITI